MSKEVIAQIRSDFKRNYGFQRKAGASHDEAINRALEELMLRILNHLETGKLLDILTGA